MDNITHSLVGVALADLLVRSGGTRSDRRLFAGAGVVAANLPDLDLIYSSITPAPLGYLLHHRGHTHTVLGLIGLAAALVLAYRGVTPIRKLRPGDRVRLWMLIVIGLASHVSLDGLNNYGVHPFWPIDSSWYYGDAVFIFEPSLWVLLGLAIALRPRHRRARILSVLPIVIFPVLMVSIGVIATEAVAAFAFGGVVFTWFTRELSARGRAGVALAASALIIAGLLTVSRSARTAAIEVLEPELRGRLVDVVMTPNPSSPLCWGVIGVELDDARGRYVLWRGTLSLGTSWKPPTACASHRLAGPGPARLIANGRFALRDAHVQSVRLLRERAERDCWTRAWLQFGRAPVMTDRTIYDLRFGERFGQNFTYMQLRGSSEAPACPPYLPAWKMPRGDLLAP